MADKGFRGLEVVPVVVKYCTQKSQPALTKNIALLHAEINRASLEPREERFQLQTV